MKVAVVGSIIQDLFLSYSADHKKILGEKVELQNIAFSLGGGGANTAVSFARQGYDVILGAKKSIYDCMGDILQRLQQEKINTEKIAITDQAPTGMSLIFPYHKSDQTIFIYRGANSYLTLQDCSFIDECAYDALYVTALAGPSAAILPVIAKKAFLAKTLVAINPGKDQIINSSPMVLAALPYVSILLVNQREALLLYEQLDRSLSYDTKIDSATLQRFFKKMHHKGPRIIIVTAGKQGVYVSDSSTLYYYPSCVLASDLVSTVGAGDAFGSAFVGTYLKTMSVLEGLKAGVVNSASVVLHQGAQQGLLDLHALHARMDSLDFALLKTYSQK